MNAGSEVRKGRDMKTLLATIAAIGIWATTGSEAQAQGAHFRVGRVHVDVGHPHRGYYGGHAHRYSHYGIYGGYYAQPYQAHYRGYHGGYGHSHWHDTSHYDYHPGGYVRHYDHYDYVPGHYDYHHEGHWDHH